MAPLAAGGHEDFFPPSFSSLDIARQI
jgi:hypothetical protein